MNKKKMKFQQLLYREHYEKEEGVSNSRLNDLFDNYQFDSAFFKDLMKKIMK